MRRCGTMSGMIHQALVYSSEEEFLAAAVPYISDGIEAGERVLAVTTTANVDALTKTLDGELDEIDLRAAEQWYRTPGQTLLAYQRYVNEHGSENRRVRIVGEPVWDGRSAAAVREWARYESVINVAFDGSPTRVLCPYDARVLAAPILEHADCTHPEIVTGPHTRRSPGFLEPSRFCSRLDQEPLEEPTAPVTTLVVEDLAAVRRFVSERAVAAGLGRRRASDLTLAVHELTTNAQRHAKGPVEVRLWLGPHELVCEVVDAGPGIGDPLAGHLEPDAFALNGRGLWLVRQLCDLLETRSTSSGARVRVHMSTI